MPYDLLIKGGTVVDGTGLPRYRTDIGIKDGKVIARGRLSGGAAQVIDAEGKIVAPGFIDIHTHYDAQVLWDPLLTPSPSHGATTVIMGNCGFSLAPTLPRDRQYLTEMFAEVEGMSLTALKAGVDWGWETFPQYIDHIAAKPHGINVATMVGHSALRRYALGADSSHRASTPDEMKLIEHLFREGMEAGAFGLSTSRSTLHKGMDKLPVASRLATREEFLRLCAIMADYNVGGIEVVTQNIAIGADRLPEEEASLMIEASQLSGRQVNYNELSFDWDQPKRHLNHLDYMARANREGASVFGVLRCQRLDTQVNLKDPGLFITWPKWQEVLSQPAEQRNASLRDPGVRAGLRSEMEHLDSSVTRARRIASMGFVRAKSGRHAQHERRLLTEIGKELGKHPVDIMLDWSLEENFEVDFCFTGVRNGDPAEVATLLRSPYTLAGLSDGGAHTNRQSGTYYSTFLLKEWVRDHPVITLEEAIRRLTSVQASMYSLWDRGMIREGLAADIVIFDLEKLDWLPGERVSDLPAGDERIVNGSTGYEHLIINGQVVANHNQPTGNIPGKVLRSTDYAYKAK